MPVFRGTKHPYSKTFSLHRQVVGSGEGSSEVSSCAPLLLRELIDSNWFGDNCFKKWRVKAALWGRKNNDPFSQVLWTQDWDVPDTDTEMVSSSVNLSRPPLKHHIG